jgi:hypothetical protein
MRICRHLRWKSVAREHGAARRLHASLMRGQVPCACLRTCQPWGPDDDLAAPETCTPDRACFSDPDPEPAPDPE